mmetsp:Transcript_10751/g.28572  ORF Transcript_10751/g.28572 Transcript_10751/m.28572 type:complete len:444 (-) Transcript_10751:225-1556(-)|eukprot:CAMPEP_0177194924 /NCGR_PEP_ID=MMETSP0367-20130122/23234_1 /TAXON_ID=447022 ORGANISM="Scrippsiella hangoei-like, Strain SHHI-4" /NCGR_SAMPLE_ID=MMETSP0367 /ASSEMBLY_ACC=CAM_ASM_000362 /LENGTH=443 /DNA_ID=CAMNT_0018642907 /DNA_START=70 /DNA_END=1401 /DNA_ORIENTATION=+
MAPSNAHGCTQKWWAQEGPHKHSLTSTGAGNAHKGKARGNCRSFGQPGHFAADCAGNGNGGPLANAKASAAAAVPAPAPREDELCAFLRGTGRDFPEYRTLDQILAWSDQMFEVVHDFVQWIFPTDQPSAFNEDAPMLDEGRQKICRADPQIRRNLQRVLERFIKFLGLCWNLDSRGDGEPLRISRAAHFENRLLAWKWQSHNTKRLSRALRCLALTGLEEEQQALLACLEEILVDYPGMIHETTISHWVSEGCAKSQLVHLLTPGYVTALLQSPALREQFGKQHFARYDLDLDGTLEVSEALALAGELYARLGVSAEALDTVQFAGAAIAHGLSGFLSEAHFAAWFVAALSGAAEKREQLTTAAKVAEPSDDQVSSPTCLAMPVLLNAPDVWKGLPELNVKEDTYVNGEVVDEESFVNFPFLQGKVIVKSIDEILLNLLARA